MIDVNKRLSLIVNRFFKTKTDMCHQLGVSMVSVYHWGNRGNIPSRQIPRIMELCPGINMQWLITGEGPMMVEEAQSTQKPKKTVTANNIELAGKPIPFYEDVLVSCGVVEMPVQREDTSYITVPGADAQFMMRASGDSMSPVIENGDLIGMKEMGQFEGFKRDQAYLIITRSANCMVKYVNDPGATVPYLELSSANPNYYMSVEERHLEKETVIKIFKVTFVGHVNPF